MIKLFFGVLIVIAVGALSFPLSEATQFDTNQNNNQIVVVAENLQIPWAIAFLPQGDILVTERPGTLKKVNSKNKVTTVGTIDEVLHIGEGGLLGVTVHPNFTENNFIYLYYTYGNSGNQTLNRVVRYQFKDEKLSDKKVIIDQIPGAKNHNGGRILFGPDGYLYITTGDAEEPSLAQNKDSLAGKILRVTGEGEPAANNPFGNLVYSYGHRNPQGLAWDYQGRLWSTEHGPSTRDELNMIESGKNYGWPVVQGDQTRQGMELAVMQSGSNTWAPAGLAFYQGKFYFAGLRGNALFSYSPEKRDQVNMHFEGQYGRLREAIIAPDGYLLVTTSNRDGRGSVKPGDDKILRVNLNSL